MPKIRKEQSENEMVYQCPHRRGTTETVPPTDEKASSRRRRKHRGREADKRRIRPLVRRFKPSRSARAPPRGEQDTTEDKAAEDKAIRAVLDALAGIDADVEIGCGLLATVFHIRSC